VNVDKFAQQMNGLYYRLGELYEDIVGTYPGAMTARTTHSGLTRNVVAERQGMPEALRELGFASEELKVAVEELYQQNNELIATRQAVEVERQRYQELFEFAPGGYLVTDEAGKISEANDAAAKLLNVSQSFLVGKPLTVFIPPAERQYFRSSLSSLQQQPSCGVNSHRRHEWVFPLQPRHGELFQAALSVAGTCDQQGRIVALRWWIRDITEQQRAEAVLEKTDYDLYTDRPSQTYCNGEVIPLSGEYIWLVRQGLVKLSTFSEQSEEVLVGLAGPSMTFGSGLTSLPAYQATVLSDQVHLVSVSLTEIAASPQLAQSLLPRINQRLQQTESLLAIAGQRHVTKRLSQLLLLLKQEFGQPVAEGTRLTVRLTHQELANACCTTRVTVTRQLQEFQQQGKITLCPQRHLVLKEHAF